MRNQDHQPTRFDISLLEASASEDARLVDQLTDLINDVYTTAERGLWREGWARTAAPELAELIRAREIAVAARHGHVVGSIRVHDVADDTGEFGMLVADPAQRGTGIGRSLVAFAEERALERGLQTMQLELLVPREWPHPSKEFLRGWYGRLGYRLVRTGSLGDDYPQLAPLLATPCDLTVYQKPLRVLSCSPSG